MYVSVCILFICILYVFLFLYVYKCVCVLCLVGGGFVYLSTKAQREHKELIIKYSSFIMTQ